MIRSRRWVAVMTKSGSRARAAVALRSDHGFTLVEILIAIAVFAVVMTTVTAVFLAGLRTRAEGAENMMLEREGSIVLERMMRGLYGRGGLREANSGTVTLGADGGSIWFEVDRNSTPTKTRADDTTSLIYLFEGDVYYRPDTSVSDKDCISLGQGHVESLTFDYTPSVVDITIKLVSPLPGTDRNAFVHLTKSIKLRN